MHGYIRSTSTFLALALAPFVADAGTPPTAFPAGQYKELKAQLASLEEAQISAQEARQMALLIQADASTRDADDIAGLLADQNMVLALAELSESDAEILAVHANLLAMQAGMETSVGMTLRLSKLSTRTLDKLVRDNPENGGVLMQRALNGLYAPRIAGRIKIAVSDFETLLGGEFGLTSPDRAQIMTLLGQAYVKARRVNDAKIVLAEVADADVPYWSSEAQTILDGI